MLPHHAPAPQPQADANIARIGVGIDTSRYGHYAAFLRDDLQPAAGELQFVESAAGYAQLRTHLEQIVSKHGTVHFVVRLDAAGQYADNLLHFLHDRSKVGSANATFTISCGDPQRNKNYRAALFGSQKSDPVEARAAARYALNERPAPAKLLSAELRTLRQVASRLQAVVRQRTRLSISSTCCWRSPFPNSPCSSRTSPSAGSSPSANAIPPPNCWPPPSAHDLGQIPYLPDKQIEPLLEHARTSVASLTDDTVAELVRDQVRQLRDVRATPITPGKNLGQTPIDGFPTPTISTPSPASATSPPPSSPPSFSTSTASRRPIKLVAYFGVMPIEVSTGVDRDGKPRSAKRYVMCRRGNDLVRRYLWMAALSAVRYNPAVRVLYARVVAKHPDHKAIAIGHAMRKLLHLAFAIWKTKKPFDKNFYRWDAPAHIAAGNMRPEPAGARPGRGPQDSAEPAWKEVTAACDASLAHDAEPDQHAFVDFAHVKKQLPIARVLEHLGLTGKLQGTGAAEAQCLPDPLPARPWPPLQREPGRQRLPVLRAPVARRRAT